VNLLSRLLPNPALVRLETWSVEPAPASITVTLRSRPYQTRCPLCGKRSKRTHSRYERTLADLPWGEHAMTIKLGVRRMFCDSALCKRRIFTERLPGIAAPWARKTTRLADRLMAVGVALGGSVGVRLCRKLGLVACRNTLLSVIRQAPMPPVVTPSVLGVDDWSLRKRDTYGTVLVDLERRRPVALLPGREADTLAAWLREHPGVAVIARDRSGAYAKGARHAAPGAIQVADRFHLLQNLAEALEVVFSTHAKDLHAAEQARRDAMLAERGTVPIAPSEPQAKAKLLAAERRTRRLARHEQVWALYRQGWSGEKIAPHLGISRTTVYRCLRSEVFPERKGRSDAGYSRLDPWRHVVLEHWNGDRRNSRKMSQDLQQRGYRGSYPTLARYLRRLRAVRAVDNAMAASGLPALAQPTLDTAPRRVLTPRTVTWTVLRRAKKRTMESQALLADLRKRSPALNQAVELAEAFTALVRDRAPAQLDAWLQQAEDSVVPSLQRFAKRLRADYDAIHAALSLAWSNGQTEGQINRLKTIKRQMYGRAGLDLLERRFLLAA
jgi:transposase